MPTLARSLMSIKYFGLYVTNKPIVNHEKEEDIHMGGLQEKENHLTGCKLISDKITARSCTEFRPCTHVHILKQEHHVGYVYNMGCFPLC